MSRLSLARKVGASDSLLLRIEDGAETRGSLLAALIRALNADADDVVDLLNDPNATEEDGVRRADQRIQMLSKRQEVLSPGQGTQIQGELQSLIARMTEYELGKWVILGERLVEEREKQ
jgi:hypothetical protein